MNEYVMKLAPIWVLMIIWLSIVAYTAYQAAKKKQIVKGFYAKKQLSILITGLILVIVGDFIHTIGFTVKTLTNASPETYGFVTFTLYFDGMIFLVFYALWQYFLVLRYQEGKIEAYDKIVFTLAAIAIMAMAPGIIPDAFGIYTQRYIVAPYSVHVALFIIYGTLSVIKTIIKAKEKKDREMTHVGWALLVSFFFYTLTVVLLLVNPLFGMFMIPKTFAYIYAFVFLNKAIEKMT